MHKNIVWLRLGTPASYEPQRDNKNSTEMHSAININNNKSTKDLQLNELNKNGEVRVTGELALFESPATCVCVEAGLQP